MTGDKFSFFTPDQSLELKKRVFKLLSQNGVKLDPHAEMFEYLSGYGALVDKDSGIVRIPEQVLDKALSQAPKKFTLGARNPDRVLDLPRSDGTFHTRTCTGAHGYIAPETGEYRKLTLADLGAWARLVDRLDEISFLAYLFPNDVPVASADVHALAQILKNTGKHAWVQPYSTESIKYLIKLSAAAAGGENNLKDNPVVSFIACSLTPRSFKYMDLEIIRQTAELGIPIQACSLPGAGGTAPATIPGVILVAVAEILAMVVMAQAVRPGTPVVACPIIFSTDMQTGRSLQSSVEAMKGASGAIQFIKAAFNLPTHNYGSGADSPAVDEQSMSERAILTTLMGLSGSDILGGAGQLEVATAVSPLQLIVDHEVLGMVRRLSGGFRLDDDQLGWDILQETAPGHHFMTSKHTLRHCRDGFNPRNFIRHARDKWEREGKESLLDRALADYNSLMAEEAAGRADQNLIKELEAVVAEADKSLA